MSKVSTNISLDPKLKEDAIKLFSSFGLDLSTAISLFLSQAVREQRIPFEITEVPNKETLEAFKEFEEMRKNKEKYNRYSSFQEVLKEVEEEIACSESSNQTNSKKTSN